MNSFPSSALASHVSAGRIMKFPVDFGQFLKGAAVPDRLVKEGATLLELHLDHKDSGWCGTTGNEVTYIMLQHVPQPDLRVQITSPEVIRNVIEGLEWLSSTWARVAGRVAVPIRTGKEGKGKGKGRKDKGRKGKATERVIPHGYMVSLPSLEECLGRKLFRQKDGKLVPIEEPEHYIAFCPMQLVFTLPEFDVCPSAKTQFLKGDNVFFGCREKSFRYITIDDRIDLDALSQCLNDDNLVTRKVTVNCLKEALPHGEGIMCEMTLLPGFRFCGHSDKGEIISGPEALQLSKTLVFEIIPQAIVESNFCDSLLRDPCKLEFDYFRVAKLGVNEDYPDGKPFRLGDPSSPLSRSTMRVNIPGVARPGDQGDYNVDWFPGPNSTVMHEDLVLLPRLPATSAIGPSRRFWNDADVSSVAHLNAAVDVATCSICRDGRKTHMLVRCGHLVCEPCGVRFNVPDGECPFCRQSIEHVIPMRDA